MKVLIVDDDPVVRTTVTRVLAREHEVKSVANAHEAVALVSGGAWFDVILCDLMMPGISGMDLHAEVMRVAPAQAARIAFVTGGAFTPQALAVLDGVRNPRLEKPFGLQALKALVADVATAP